MLIVEMPVHNLEDSRLNLQVAGVVGVAGELGQRDSSNSPAGNPPGHREFLDGP